MTEKLTTGISIPKLDKCYMYHAKDKYTIGLGFTARGTI